VLNAALNINIRPVQNNIQQEKPPVKPLQQKQPPLSFGNAALSGGLMGKVSKGATSLILKINQSRLPGPIKAWSTYMIANVPILSNVVFKSPITEGDLIFATAAALPFARTVSEVPDRRREAFLRDMSGFLIFLTCVRAVQGLQWEKPLKFLSQAKPLQSLAKQESINLLNVVTNMFPDTQKMLGEIARVDKVDDIIRAATQKGNADDALKAIVNSVKDSSSRNSMQAYFSRVPRAKEHFLKALKSAGGSKEGLKESLKNFNKLKSFRSVAGAIIGGIVYILISGIGINKLNQYLAKRKEAKNQPAPDLKPKGIPFAAKISEMPVRDNIVAGNHSNRQLFMSELTTWTSR
jgi:hypothetical protein